MKHLLRTTLPILSAGFLVALTGCQSKTNHYSTAVLREQTRTGEFILPEYLPAITYSSNVVRVPRDSRYLVQIDAINPGWIHQNIHYNLDEKRLEGEIKNNQKFKNRETQHLQNKSLWIVYEIKSKSLGDPMEFESKKIIKSSVVKYGSRSFGVIPLDYEEAAAFALEATNIYDVKISIYEVRNVEIKRILIDGIKNNPGLSRLIADLGATTQSTFKSLIGDPVINIFKKEYGEDLAIERLALTLDAAKQFEGSFTVIRDIKPTTDVSQKKYVLVDEYKSHTQILTPHLAVDSPTDYRNAIEKWQSSEWKPNAYQAFLEFRVISSPKPKIDEKNLRETPANAEFENEEKKAREALTGAESEMQNAISELRTADSAFEEEDKLAIKNRDKLDQLKEDIRNKKINVLTAQNKKIEAIQAIEFYEQEKLTQKELIDKINSAQLY